MSTGLQRIGRYELTKRLASSKTSEVWIALDPRSRSNVTIKIFYTDIQVDSDSILEFRQRVEHIASLHHPNIARIHDTFIFPSNDSSGRTASTVCIVMDYTESHTLADHLHHGRGAGKIRPGADIVQLFTSLSLALDYAHQQGITHGNLNPGSILLKRDGLTTADQIGEAVLTDFDYTKTLHQTGGTVNPFYLSPEQIRGLPATPRSDTYSLGVILYELCTGVLPFRGNRPIAIMMQHLNAPPTAPEAMNPTLSSALTSVILHSLAKEPEKRFSSASALTVALAHALSIPVSEKLGLTTFEPEASSNHGFHPLLQPDPTPFTESFRKSEESTLTQPASNGSGTTFPSAADMQRRKKRSHNVWYLISISVLLLASLGTIATLLLIPRNQASAPNPLAPNQLVGHAFFLNSGQFNANNPQGINDELQIELSGIPDPPAGKSYYAWLLADQSVSEALPLSLGALHVERGSVRLLYPGDHQHTNLLGNASRFLITVDDAHHPTNNPLIDAGSWRYYAAIPLTPSPLDKLHFSMLDHLRHLLYESPELSIRNLHGGLAFWFVRNTATISERANGARDAWNKKDNATIRNQVIGLLDYIDGQSFARTDLPPHTPLLANARASQIALLGPAPQNPDAPGYAYKGEIPPGYVYLISEHMVGAIQSPQTTPEQRGLAVQINTGLDNVKLLFEQIHQDAKQLLSMNDAQLLQPPALALLDDMAKQAQFAYTGQTNPSTGQSDGGALWIYGNLQRLTAFDIRQYTASTP